MLPRQTNPPENNFPAPPSVRTTCCPAIRFQGHLPAFSSMRQVREEPSSLHRTHSALGLCSALFFNLTTSLLLLERHDLGCPCHPSRGSSHVADTLCLATLQKVAERLYLAGLVSYPRTETTRYDPSFDLEGALQMQVANPIWGSIASGLLKRPGGVQHPTAGVDAGDHPPITPVRGATRASIRGDADWRVRSESCPVQH